jgi:6-phosphogluconate dehydrogenase
MHDNKAVLYACIVHVIARTAVYSCSTTCILYMPWHDNNSGVACPAMSASLSYFDSYRRARLPANLVQAQRDFFGGHTYERIDR